MQNLTPDGQRIVEELARKYAVSADAVISLLGAVAAGNGFQAQFNHPELGGMGQWSQGGMIMIGDMFNQGLKYKVSGLCEDLANVIRNQPLFAPPNPSQMQSQGYGQSQQQGMGGGASLFVQGGGYGPWWPADMGSPSSSGGQNDMSYAYFPSARRLAIKLGGDVRIYDTGDHNIGGVSQQQSGDQSLTFTSQYGLVRVEDLPLVSPAPDVSAPTPAASAAAMRPEEETQPQAAPQPQSSHEAVFAVIEKLAALRDKNILTEEEFAAKKTELLSRL